MENASKAILIAGGVLLALMVISICMFVIYNARDVFSSMEEKRQAQIVQEQMTKFAEYVGLNSSEYIYGSEVNNCIKRIKSYNDTVSAEYKIDEITSVSGITLNVIGSKYEVKNEDRNKLFRGIMLTKNNGSIRSIIFTKV